MHDIVCRKPTQKNDLWTTLIDETLKSYVFTDNTKVNLIQPNITI